MTVLRGVSALRPVGRAVGSVDDKAVAGVASGGASYASNLSEWEQWGGVPGTHHVAATK